MAGKGQKGSPLWYGPAGKGVYRHPSPETYDDDTVTIVVPRRAAEDFYYAISLAIGGRSGFVGFAPGTKGGMTMKYGKPNGPRGKG